MSGTQGVVTFDYAAWGALFPELAAVISKPQAGLYFGMACQYVANTPASLVPLTDAYANPVREPLLNLVTAHISALLGPTSSETVGRVGSATQGSVSVTLDMGQTSQNAAWWQQTKYGAMAWEMLKPYRSFRYFQGRQRYLGVQNGGRTGYGG